MATKLLEIEPRELKFIVEPKKLSECSIQLINKSDQYVAFKVKTTSPKKYCVRPNLGVINPGEACDFTVTMQAQRTAPSDLHCKDKFLVESTVVPAGTNEEDLPSDTFARDGKKFIEDKKLRVVLVNAPSSLLLHPVNVELKQDQVKEISAQKDGAESVSSPPKIIEDVKDTVNSVDELETPTDMFKPRPSKDMDKSTPETPTDMLKPRPSKDIDKSTPETPTDMLKPRPSKDMDKSTPETPKDMLKPRPSKDMDKSTPQDMDKQRPAKDLEGFENSKEVDNESRAAKKMEMSENAKGVEAFRSILETKMPKNIAELRAKKAISRTFEFVEKIKPRMNAEKFKLAHELGVLKSKNIVMDTKLREAEHALKKLMEERSTVSREKDNLRHEIEILRKGNVRRVEVGFPFLYVCSVALISVTFGYLIHF